MGCRGCLRLANFSRTSAAGGPIPPQLSVCASASVYRPVGGLLHLCPSPSLGVSLSSNLQLSLSLCPSLYPDLCQPPPRLLACPVTHILFLFFPPHSCPWHSAGKQDVKCVVRRSNFVQVVWVRTLHAARNGGTSRRVMLSSTRLRAAAGVG